MKIRCVANTGASLPEHYLDPSGGYTKDLKFGLTIGKEYVVYAFYERQGQVWYYIADDQYMYYPMQNPAPLFEVVDDRLSKYWRFKLWENGLLYHFNKVMTVAQILKPPFQSYALLAYFLTISDSCYVMI